jgi:hypothetical protein
MDVDTVDRLNQIARRIEVVRLAVVGASTDAARQAIEDSLNDIGVDLRAATNTVSPRSQTLHRNDHPDACRRALWRESKNGAELRRVVVLGPRRAVDGQRSEEKA